MLYLGKKSHYSRCLSDIAVSRFKELIPAELAATPSSNIMGSYADFTPLQVDYLVDSTAAALLGTLDAVVITHKRIASWYSPNLRTLKQKTRQHWKGKHIPANVRKTIKPGRIVY